LAKAAAWARAKPNSAIRRAAPEEVLAVFFAEPGTHGATHEPIALGLHLLVAAVRAHRLAEDVRLEGGVAAHLDRDLHHLLLVEDHAQGVLQDGLEARMQVGDRLGSGSASQVGVDGVPLDRAGANDRDLHHQVLEALRPALRERLHLGAALDLEHADRVRGADRPEHRGVVVGK